MSVKVYGKARFKIRSNTTLEWEKENPILLKGEPGAVIGDNEDEIEKLKIGDGVTPWNELGWWKGPKGDTGPQGEKGDKGDKGEKGDAGVIKFIPVVELPTENINLSAVYLVPVVDAKGNNRFLEYIYFDGAWELIGNISADINIDEYIKNTDFATLSKAGVVQLSGYYGIMAEGAILRGTTCSKDDYTNKHNNFFIAKGTLDNIKNQYVKEGLTANTETLTAEEKAAALNWLGAVPLANFVSNMPQVYVKKEDGTQGRLNLVEHYNSATTGVPKYFTGTDTDGNLRYMQLSVNPIPTEGHSATSKQYVDNGFTSLAIFKTINGSYKNIAVDDVSPLNHKCFCKLTSDTYTSGGSNNIFETTSTNPRINDDYGSDIPKLTTIRNEDGSITIKGYTNCRAHCSFIFYNLTAGKTYTFSLRSEGGSLGEFDTFERDENGDFIGAVETSTAVSHTFTVSENANNRVFDWSYWGSYEGETEPLDITIYPQLEEGSTMTDWMAFAGAPETKPYIEDLSTVKISVNGMEYTPNIDGTVEFMSESPTMEITTDNEHANIVELDYCVDTKKYIDNKETDLKEYVDKGFLPLTTTTDATFNRVYAVNTNGEQILLRAAGGQGANKIPITDGYGCLQVAAPKSNNSAANKAYVDGAIATLREELLGMLNQ